MDFLRKMTFCALSMVHFSELEEWETKVQADQRIQRIIQNLIQNSQLYPDYIFVDRKLFYDRKLVLPKNSSKIPISLPLHILSPPRVWMNCSFKRLYVYTSSRQQQNLVETRSTSVIFGLKFFVVSTKLKFSTTYHPQIEVVNRCVETYPLV